MQTFLLILAAVIAYLLGSVSFSYIYAKKFRHEDIRTRGSGNAGTTNMLRNYGWKFGLATLLCDVFKGVFSALIGLWLAGPGGMYLAAVMVVVGHNYPVFLHFRGGKGIAAAIGAFYVIQPLASLIVTVICVIVVLFVRIMSVGSLLGMLLSFIAACFIAHGNWQWITAAGVICLLTFIAHRENLVRLLHGEERKISVGKRR